ncbi:MAG: hypothetical protein ABSH48_27055 [Verrucomicrobiota bacterium]
MATDGSDSYAGTNLTEPFQTVQQAASVAVAGDTCCIRAGVYHETLIPLHSGSSNAPITFEAYSNEVVTLDGADVVTGWSLLSNGVYQASVGWDLGEGDNQVFVDGVMIHEAQYPAYGSGDVLHPTTVSVVVNNTNTALISSAAWSGKPDNYWAGAWFLGGVDPAWAWQSAQVVSSTGTTITVDPATETGGWWFAGSGNGLLWGSPNFLSADNEWSLGTNATGYMLRLRIAGGNDPTPHTVEMKRRSWCVNLYYRNYVAISGLNLWGGAVRLQGNGNLFQNCRAQFLSHYRVITGGYLENGGSDQGGGVVINGNGNLVRGCTIGNTAGSGIYTAGTSNRITRNVIFNTDYSGTYASSIALHGISDIVTFNTAYCSGRDILRPEGIESDIQFNDLSAPGLLCQDIGVVYSWGIDGQNTRIAYNWIHDNSFPIPSPLIYLDAWDRNYIVDHNVCWGSGGDSGIRINGPAVGYLIYNNTLFNCADVGAYAVDSWPNSNPDPAFWTNDINQYSASNNLFLANAPQAQLVNWNSLDFCLKAGATAIDSGVIIPGFTDGYLGSAPDLGAYEFGGLPWTAGIASQPILAVTDLDGGQIKLTASADAGYYSLVVATNLVPPILWMPVTNNPFASGNQWSLIVSPANVNCYYSLHTNSGSAWIYASARPIPSIYTQPAPETVNEGGPASLSVTASGIGPLFYQWCDDSQPIPGATNSSQVIFPAVAGANYDVVISNAGGSVTSSIAPLTIRAPYLVAYWRMEGQITAPNNAGAPTFVGVADSATNSGQGIFTTGSLPAAVDDLIAFNGLPGDPVTLSTNVAPDSMFVNQHSAGRFSYNAETIANVDGCLFFPQDQYGDEMDFTGPFSIELFFKTDGNRSGAGKMQLVSQGTDTGQVFRYGINANEAGPGGIRFKIANDNLGQFNQIDLTGVNYTDGQWHYLLAVCDTMAGANGQLRLTIANPDGSQASATNHLQAGFLPLPATDNGNLFLGRNTYPVNVAPETFLGLIDEVQITAGVVPDTWRIGCVPAIDNHPLISRVSFGTNGFSFRWNGAAMNNFLVQWTPELGMAWQTIAILPSAASQGFYTDSDFSGTAARSRFYRIVSQ